LNICYYHQDLRPWQLHSASRLKLRRYHGGPPTRRSILSAIPRGERHNSATPARYRSVAEAPSIFRAGWFGRWVVTHSLADSDFQGHRPAVYTNQHLFWYLMRDNAFGTLTKRLVHPTAPVLLTKNGPLVTHSFVLRLVSN